MYKRCRFQYLDSAGIPIEHVKDVFRVHWYWKRFFDSEDEDEGLKAQREIIELLKQRKARARGSGKSGTGYFSWPLRTGSDADKMMSRAESANSQSTDSEVLSHGEAASGQKEKEKKKRQDSSFMLRSPFSSVRSTSSHEA